MSNNIDIDEDVKLGILSITILVISGMVIIFSFFAPYFFVLESKSGIDFSTTGQIGDTVGGIMNPFIAISGVLLTFLAFYIQFRANRLQRKLFRLELNEQKEQFKKNQVENQFYEMLRLHKENVNELQIENTISGFNVNGRRVFEFFIKEFELCYKIARYNFPDSPVKDVVNEAYGVFFHGINDGITHKHIFFKQIYDIRTEHRFANYKYLQNNIRNKINIDLGYELNYPILLGYSSKLAHYYRHLFQTVKFIANNDNELITYEDKRRYLRILRAQLSNQEQVMLFYNWLSDFGRQWENQTNRFFTDFRMIHNIYQDLLLPEVELTKLIDLNGSFLKEKDRKVDHLFEFQDW